MSKALPTRLLLSFWTLRHLSQCSPYSIYKEDEVSTMKSKLQKHHVAISLAMSIEIVVAQWVKVWSINYWAIQLARCFSAEEFVFFHTNWDMRK